VLLELVEDLASFGGIGSESGVVVEVGDEGRGEGEGEELREGRLDFLGPERVGGGG
jgi:hypothetical protein